LQAYFVFYLFNFYQVHVQCTLCCTLGVSHMMTLHLATSQQGPKGHNAQLWAYIIRIFIHYLLAWFYELFLFKLSLSSTRSSQGDFYACTIAHVTSGFGFPEGNIKQIKKNDHQSRLKN